MKILFGKTPERQLSDAQSDFNRLAAKLAEDQQALASIETERTAAVNAAADDTGDAIDLTVVRRLDDRIIELRTRIEIGRLKAERARDRLAMARRTAETAARESAQANYRAVLTDAPAELRRAIEALASIEAAHHACVAAGVEAPLLDGADVGLPVHLGHSVRRIEAYLAAPERPEPAKADPNRAVRFIERWAKSGLGGGAYSACEVAAFAPEVAARVVAAGAAEWVTPTSENAALTEAAKRQIELERTPDGPRSPYAA